MALFGNDYDSVQVGGGKALPAGGYICRIIKARMTQSSKGLPMVEALFDICDGEYANYFNEKYKANLMKNPQSEYPNNGRAKVVAVNEDGTTKATFKGFVTSIENSNDLTMPRNDEAFISALSGKLIGVIFGREEFQGTDGKTHWATKPRWYRSVADIQSGNFDVPKDTYINKSSAYNNTATVADSLFGSDIPDNFSAAEDDIPF